MEMSTATPIQLCNPSSFFFGKIASRGDFVKSASGTNVITLVDQWIAQGMEMLAAYPDWKIYYDNTPAIDFLFIALNKRHAICGCLIPSGDRSTRRFPFVVAAIFETDNSLALLTFGPFILQKPLNRQRVMAHHAAKTLDATDALAALSDTLFEYDVAQDEIVHAYNNFLANTTVGALAGFFRFEDGHAGLRKTILAIGYLLQPILSNSAAPPQKGIAMPLPHVPAQCVLVKALWLHMVSFFLTGAEFDLSVFSCIQAGRPTLIVTFNGTTPSNFAALFNDHAAQERLIDVTQSDWVEECVRQYPATSRLARELEYESLSLRQMTEMFYQAFLD